MSEEMKVKKLQSPFAYNLIYIYEIPDEDHKNCLKIGKASFNTNEKININDKNTDLLNKSAKDRINQQTGTSAVRYYLKHTEIAIKEELKNGKKELVSFLDDDVHDVLLNSGIKRAKFELDANPREWFKVELQTAINAIKAVKEGRKSLNNSEINPEFKGITLYPNQENAVSRTLTNFKHSNTMLWDAKMRFGKTITALELIKRMNKQPNIYGETKKVIIATHRPEVIEQWFGDFRTVFYEKDSTWKFGSKVKGFGLPIESLIKCENFICFASLQDLRGAKKVGGNFEKNNELYDTKWDLLIIDEAHEGTLTELGENVFNELIDDSKEHKTKVLRLSGTPFNIINQYDEKEIYSWSYIDEQEAKLNWDYFKNPKNPYAKMPKMNVYTYDLGTILNNPHYLDDKMFNFGEFFRVWTGNKEEDIADDGSFVSVSEDKIGKFVHEQDVINFLNLLSKEDEGNNYPFSTKEYQDYFKHTLWMLPGVKEAHALSRLLREHKVFGHGDFEIINVAGDGDEIEKNNEEALRKTKRALDKVKDAIAKYERTITLSCQRLTTGVTVPEWTAVFMLYGSSQVAAQRYMQTIFRVQSPASINGKMKENCFVFEFAPDRALKVLAKTAHLSHQAGKVNSPETKKLMERLLQFCPVVAINGSQMNAYNVSTMIKQLKSAYIDDIVDSGFENRRIYNLDQLNLENINLKDFEDCDNILKGTSQSRSKTTVKVTENNLDKKDESTINVGQQKSPEQKKREKEAQKAIRILNAIMTKVPLMVYGLSIDKNKEITYDNFTDLIDDASWAEFMPKDATKEKFKLFKKYIDIEMFELCNEELRNQINAANKLSINERIKRLTPLFLKFRNPDKETVLTPWRVVNMHLGDCLGGYNFYNENYTTALDEPRFINNGQVTRDVFKNSNSKVLEINSKTGLYPLYLAYSLFRYKLSNPLEMRTEKQVWKDVIENNIYVVCQTKMSEYITIQTLTGGTLNIRVNIFTEDLLNGLRAKETEKVNFNSIKSRVLNKSEWGIYEGGMMKFNAIVGNPPYQIDDGGAQASATPVYNLFVELSKKLNTDYISLIMPSRWMTGGKGLDKFRDIMIKDRHIIKLYDYMNPKDCFTNVDIKGGVCYFLRDERVEDLCEVHTISIDGEAVSKRLLSTSKEDIFIRDSMLLRIKNSVQNLCGKTLDTIVSARKPYGLEAETMVNAAKYGLPDFFCEQLQDCYRIIGLGEKQKRVWKYIPKDYPIPKENEGLNKYKVFIAEAYGCGAIGEVPSTPVLGTPGELCTETFLQMGPFESEIEAVNCIKYIKTKFFRLLVGIQKQTQHTTKKAYRFVPLQDFTNKSDIDWSKPIPEIDKQLYKKYNLSQEEIDFIETKVKPME